MNQYFQVSSLSISLSVEGPIAKKVQTDGHIPRPRLHKFSLIPFLQQSMEIEEIRSLWLCQAVPSVPRNLRLQLSFHPKMGGSPNTEHASRQCPSHIPTSVLSTFHHTRKHTASTWRLGYISSIPNVDFSSCRTAHTS